MRFVIILCLALVGCHTKPKETDRKQVLRTALGFDPSTLDPRKGSDMTSQSVIRSLFAGLAYLDENLVPKLDLAESYTVSSDFTTYVFSLRKCSWSDGSPITATDFEETWKSALTPAYTSRCTNLFYFIKNAKKAIMGTVSLDQVGVKAIDDTTLVVELEKPNPSFLNVLMHTVFFPVHQSMRYTPLEANTPLISSGPFYLKKYDFQNQIVLKKNRHFWQADKTRLDEIKFFIIKDGETAKQMFEKQELDWLGEPISRISLDALPTLKAQGVLKWTTGAGTQWLFINTKKFPFNNVNIRKALAFAIDRSKIMHDILHIDQPTPPLGLIPKIVKKERWHPWFKDNDTKIARELFDKGLKELNIKREEFPPITISYIRDASYSKVIQAIQQMWEDVLGIVVKSESMDGPIFTKKLYNQDYEIARNGWVMQYNDPTNLLDIFKLRDMQPNFTGWENTAYIEESDIAYNCNEEEKWKHLEAAENIFFSEMPSIPISDACVPYMENPYVKGVHLNHLFQLDFREAYLE